MSGDHSTYNPTTGIGKWMYSRLPLMRLSHDSFVSYPVPRNLNYAYTFGAMLSVMLIGLSNIFLMVESLPILQKLYHLYLL